MNLTFKGFLRLYCRELTGLQTDNLKRLRDAVASDAPAAAEALMVFAAIQGKARYLLELSHGTWMEAGYAQVIGSLADSARIEDYLRSSSAPERYRKVWRAFEAKRDAIVADRRVSELMRGKTRAAMREKVISS